MSIPHMGHPQSGGEGERGPSRFPFPFRHIVLGIKRGGWSQACYEHWKYCRLAASGDWGTLRDLILNSALHLEWWYPSSLSVSSRLGNAVTSKEEPVSSRVISGIFCCYVR